MPPSLHPEVTPPREIVDLLARLAGDPLTRKTCAYGARRVAEALGGAVVQYGVAENPSQTILRPGELGHCFALVSGYLVDPWAEAVGRGAAVYHLEDPGEAAEAHRLYGPWARWRFSAP